MKTAKLILHINLDANNLPEKLAFETDDDNPIAPTESKAMLLSLWEKEKKEALKIDLWTKDMQVDEMAFFYYQTLMSMSDTFEKSTGQKTTSESMKDFAKKFYQEAQQNFEIKK
ncbi:MAG: gliding motility protein GldC [Chitinophagaceae bacterium]